MRHDHELRVNDWFAGAGGSTQGIATIPGVRPIHAANHWAKAIESHAANFPDVDHWKGDIRDIDVRKLPYAEIFWASPECFPAGTEVLTDMGQVPIEAIEVGDVVLTHTGAWRPVVRTQHRSADTVLAASVHRQIEVTSNHRFWLRAGVDGDPAFTPIGEALDHEAMWAVPDESRPGWHSWERVMSVEPARTGVIVYNIEVDEDHSYVAGGIVVANCTNWSRAKGKTQDYAVTDTALPGMEDPAPAEEVERSRALMEEVPMYLRAMALRREPVLVGVVENVVDIRDWSDWGRWRSEIEAIGYRTRLIALNSMHAQSVRAPRAPQSRDRLYLAYWHISLGRDPDWDKWLRPTAWCPTCDEWVKAVQVFKDPSRDMGRYRSQYVYRCPRIKCRNQVLEPTFLPAYTAIDWTVKGQRIGDRSKPLAEKTLRRIEAGIKRYARPIHVEASGHTYDAADPKHRQFGQETAYYRAWPVEDPLKTLHTAESKAVVVPPLLVPVEGRDGKVAATVDRPMRTQSTRSETGLVTVPPLLVPAGGTWNDDASSVMDVMRARTTRESEAVVTPPFIAELRGGGSVARPVADPLATVTASGNHHGLVVPEGGAVSWESWAALYAYDAGVRDLLQALPTQTTVEGDALVSGGWRLPSVEDCLFRMLEPHEILAGMAFRRDYVVLGNRRERVRQAGNAVTPPAAEVIVSALVECVTGEALEPAS